MVLRKKKLIIYLTMLIMFLFPLIGCSKQENQSAKAEINASVKALTRYTNIVKQFYTNNRQELIVENLSSKDFAQAKSILKRIKVNQLNKKQRIGLISCKQSAQIAEEMFEQQKKVEKLFNSEGLIDTTKEPSNPTYINGKKKFNKILRLKYNEANNQYQASIAVNKLFDDSTQQVVIANITQLSIDQALKSVDKSENTIFKEKMHQKLKSATTQLANLAEKKANQVKTETNKASSSQTVTNSTSHSTDTLSDSNHDSQTNNDSQVKEPNEVANNSILLNVPYINQYQVGEMACEASALLEALHGKGYATNYSLSSFIATMPISKSGNPNEGFGGSYQTVVANVFQSIYPAALANWGSRFGTVTNISGTSSEGLKTQLKAGHPIIIYVTMNWSNPQYHQYWWGTGIDNSHVMTLDGFKDGAYHVADPAGGLYWVPASSFEYSYNLTRYAVSVG
ncbi:C39 family peptidase [Lapidilactobacillus wuchangensis]|uniref:C39 family peptidase n=1 Tax=Lapidilactobacillus wuchangensis TaxID=2486001 RepID=UPI000F77CA42|nr:C39 family peptidase [Lapidilactobacillus wuchangensis]